MISSQNLSSYLQTLVRSDREVQVNNYLILIQRVRIEFNK